MVVKKNCFCVFSFLIVGKEAVCLDGLFIPAVFRESDFYLNSHIFAKIDPKNTVDKLNKSKNSGNVNVFKMVLLLVSC